MIVSPTGEVLADASDKTTVIQSTIEETKVREWRNSFPAVQEFLEGKN
jgi:predicted amidohydrolase